MFKLLNILNSKTNSIKKHIIKQTLIEVEKLLLELDSKGKDLSQVCIKNFRKTHYQGCKCDECIEAVKSHNIQLKGLRELGFKIFFHEQNNTEI